MESAHDDQIGDLASKIKVSDGMAPWQLVPSWLAFFLCLGEKVAVAHENGQRVAVVAVPPVRCFAAAAAAAAAVVAVAREADAVPDVEEHFSALARLPLGTALVVKMGAKIYAAKFAGVIDRGGEPVIHVEYKGMTHLIPKQQCPRIQVGSGEKTTLPTRSPRSIQSDFRSIAAIVGRRVAAQFVSVPTVDVVLVGHVALLSQELTAVMVQALSASVDEGVTLAGLFRAARFLPEGGISRSMLVSDRVAEFEMPVSDTPHVVVFDGGRAFARYRARFRQSTDGKTILPLRNGAASFVIYRNGTANIVAWGHGATVPPDVVAVRQNLDLLVDHGKPIPGLNPSDTTQWGFTLGNAVYVWRSGLGITADGALVYVGGPGLNITTLADILARAGAVRAMELDINTDWVDFAAYHPDGASGLAAPANGTNLLPDMYGGPNRYFAAWWSRDFITMSARIPAQAAASPGH